MSKLFGNILKQILILSGTTLLRANFALAEFQTPAKPIELKSVSNLSDLQFFAVNSANQLTSTEQIASLSEAQEETKPKRKAPGYSSYIGIGGDIGLSGDRTALGSGGLTIFSKTRLTNNLSIHSTNVVFGNRTATSTTALTFGIPIHNNVSEQVLAFPFVGGGILTRNINGFKVDGLVVAGIDVPISEKLTATAQVNVGFPGGDTDVGLQFGIGYNFHLF